MGQTEQDNPGLKVLPPVYPAAALALALILEWLTGLSFLDEPTIYGWQAWLGIVSLLAGLAFALSAISAFSEAGTNVEPYKPSIVLVTTGAFAVSRNPIYLGFVLMLLGISLIFSLEWGVILTPVVWLALDRFVVIREEVYLSRKFGDAYTDYRRQTRRWF